MAKKVSRINASSVMAPYNFIPFESKTIPVQEQEMMVRGVISDDLLTGDIHYTVEAKTPIFIDDGKGQFYKDEYSRSAIPGTTMRGLVRANALVLGVSDYSNDIDDYRLMFRNVANGAEKEWYNKTILGAKPDDKTKISILQNVRAGYIANENGQYRIYGTAIKSFCAEMGKMNYYILSERFISESIGSERFAYFRKYPERTQNRVDLRFRKSEDQSGKTHYKNKKNDLYKPFYAPISFSVKNERFITAVGEPNEYELKGYLVGSGFMNEKKALYVIPEIDRTECIDISAAYKSSLKDFQRDFKARENTLKQYRNVNFFNLPKAGETKPVFYIELDGKLYFGFTPRLRLFYDHSVKEGFHQNSNGFDYVKSIFGTISDKTGFKSKVSFSDAVITAADEPRPENSKVVLGEPKPTSYLDYLIQTENSDPVTYNSKDFSLRGTKRYWLHKSLSESDPNAKDAVKSDINALPKGVEFKGTVRFQNLTRAELGLLIWSLKLENDSEVNIGKAKSYGFGRSKIRDVKVRILNAAKAYNTEALSINPFTEASDGSDFVVAYKEEAEKKLGKKLAELKSVKALLTMTDANRIPDNSLTKYMSLEGFRARINSLTPLPKADEVVRPNVQGAGNNQKHQSSGENAVEATVTGMNRSGAYVYLKMKNGYRASARSNWKEYQQGERVQIIVGDYNEKYKTYNATII